MVKKGQITVKEIAMKPDEFEILKIESKPYENILLMARRVKRIEHGQNLFCEIVGEASFNKFCKMYRGKTVTAKDLNNNNQ